MIGVLLLVFGVSSILFSTLFFYAACVVASDKSAAPQQAKPTPQRPIVRHTQPSAVNVVTFNS